MATTELNYPSEIFLLTTAILDSFFTFINFPRWREYLPKSLGDTASNGLLSYTIPSLRRFPNLLTYNDFLTQTGSPHGLSSMYTYAFKTSSTNLGLIFSTEGMVVLVMLVVILRQIKAYFVPYFSSIGASVGRRRHGLEWEKHNHERIHKFGEYVFRLLYHISLSVIGIWYFWDKSWWDESKGGTRTLWLNHPNQPIEVGMTWYYLVQSAYNVEALIGLAELSFIFKTQNPFGSEKKTLQSPISFQWSPTCRGDFREMAIHHIITNLLVLGSNYFRFTRIGSMVFLIHDISDVPVDLSKLANFLKWKLGTVIFFVTMLIVWVITRLIILPFVIYKSILTESWLLVSDGTMEPLFYYAY